jgi:hypothetical protein
LNFRLVGEVGGSDGGGQKLHRHPEVTQYLLFIEKERCRNAAHRVAERKEKKKKDSNPWVRRL